MNKNILLRNSVSGHLDSWQCVRIFENVLRSIGFKTETSSATTLVSILDTPDKYVTISLLYTTRANVAYIRRGKRVEPDELKNSPTMQVKCHYEDKLNFGAYAPFSKPFYVILEEGISQIQANKKFVTVILGCFGDLLDSRLTKMLEYNSK